MKQITAADLGDHTPDSLVEMLSGGEAQIIEESIGGLIQIGNLIAQAIANGPRIKRIKALEEFQKFQQQFNLKVAQEIDALKAK